MNSGAVGDAPQADKDEIKEIKEVKEEKVENVQSDVETAGGSLENVEFLRSSATFDSNAFLQDSASEVATVVEEAKPSGIFCMFPPPPPVNFMDGTPFDILEKMKKAEEEVQPELSTQTIQFNGLENSESEFINYASQSESSIEKNPENSSESLISSDTSVINETVKTTSKDIASNTEESTLNIEESVTQALTNVFSEEAKKISDLANRVIETLKNASGNKDELAEMIQKNQELKNFIGKLLQLLEEKTGLSSNLEKQNSALIHQAKSLKDVVNITKDLLNIRNMEVGHLQSDLGTMEDMIKEERTRHNLAVKRLQEAMTINDQLKKEYLLQMGLFEKLKVKYTEKILDLSDANRQYSDFLQSRNIKFSPAERAKMVEKIVNESTK